MTDTATVERWQATRREELDAEAVYRALAVAEVDVARRAVFERLAADERRHAEHWERKLRDAGVDPGPDTPSQSARLLCRLAGEFGDTVVVPIMRDREAMATEAYLDESGEFAKDEAQHARALASLVGDVRGEPVGRALAQLQRGRAAGGNALRAAVLGASDGLLSNFSLVMGVAGAAMSSQGVLVTGVAGLLAGAFSMATRRVDLGAELARDVRAADRDRARGAASGAGRGRRGAVDSSTRPRACSRTRPRALAHRLMADKDTALGTLSREELSIDPEELGGSPMEAAVTSFLLFVAGALLPVLPFTFLSSPARPPSIASASGPRPVRHRRRHHAVHGPPRARLGPAAGGVSASPPRRSPMASAASSASA